MQFKDAESAKKCDRRLRAIRKLAEKRNMYIHLQDRGYLNVEELGAENARAIARQIGGSHYKDKGIQPWNVIDQGPREQAIGFYRYNALKYIMRAGDKGEFKEDIAKAQHYLEKLLEIL